MSQSNMTGISYMVSAMAVLSLMDAGVKWLVMRDIPVMQVIALRGWLITAFLVVLILIRFDINVVATRRLGQHIARAALGIFAPLAFFIALRYLPLADTTAIFFCAIFFMTAGSAWFLGEAVGWHRWLAIAVGFGGVLLVVRPGSSILQFAGLLPVLGALAYAMMMLWGRKLSATENTISIVFYFNLVFAVIGTAALPFVWGPLEIVDVSVLIVVSVLALAGYFLMTKAFTLSPIAVIAPYEYTSLIWALLAGYVIWGDFPDTRAWLGILVIAASGLYILYRERLHTTLQDSGKP